MTESPFGALRAALGATAGSEEEIAGVRVDPGRLERCGIPEIVYCTNKPVEAIAQACLRLAGASGRVIATRCEPAAHEAVAPILQERGLSVEFDSVARVMIAAVKGSTHPEPTGRIGLLTAGTSDWPVALEAKIVAEEAGCDVCAYRDVGVAGLHRLVQPLEDLIEFDPDAIIIAAGMDGVLPSVVSGLVDVPIIGLPTSTGYGHGGAGEGALTTMLQSCAPGIAVVNIDNGVGAGAMAALIARRATRHDADRLLHRRSTA
jgi:pyridinium-3,5-biscarboxylic acid mononucleotide synthase